MPVLHFLTASPCNLGAEIPRIMGRKPCPWPTPAFEFLHPRACACARTGWFCLPPIGVTPLFCCSWQDALLPVKTATRAGCPRARSRHALRAIPLPFRCHHGLTAPPQCPYLLKTAVVAQGFLVEGLYFVLRYLEERSVDNLHDSFACARVVVRLLGVTFDTSTIGRSMAFPNLARARVLFTNGFTDNLLTPESGPEINTYLTPSGRGLQFTYI